MKTKFIGFALVFLFSSCAHLAYNYKKEMTIQGIPCIGKTTYYKTNGNSEFMPENQLKSCILASDFGIQNYALHKDSKLFLTFEGKLDRVIISDATTFGTLHLPTGSSVFFNRWNEALNFWLPSPSIIQGYLIPASNDGIGNACYASGNLKEFWLVNDETIQGIPCTTTGNIFKVGTHAARRGSERRVRLTEDGKLERAMLAQDFNFKGKHYQKGDLIYPQQN